MTLLAVSGWIVAAALGGGIIGYFIGRHDKQINALVSKEIKEETEG